MQVRLNTDTEIGLPLETYIVNESLAIESKDLSEEKERLKAYICRKQGIKLLKLPYKANEEEIEYIRKIKKLRRGGGISTGIVQKDQLRPKTQQEKTTK